MKKLLDSNEIIEHMRNKGILFNIVNETDAKAFLENNNYYFKLSSYRKNYDKHIKGINKGKYINLEFAYLRELSTIDCHLRYLILELCLDIEHALKLLIVNEIQNNPQEDGYNIIRQWNPSYSIVANIYNKMNKSYSRDLIFKYHPNYPIYAILELITFGEVCKLIDFYNKIYPHRLGFDTKLLYSVRNLRNACAHNACLINNLRANTSNNAPNASLLKVLQKSKFATNDSIIKKLKCQQYHDFLCLLLLYPQIVHSENQRQKTLTKLSLLIEKRLRKNKSYFIKNNTISSFYFFLLKSYRHVFKKYLTN